MVSPALIVSSWLDISGLPGCSHNPESVTAQGDIPCNIWNLLHYLRINVFAGLHRAVLRGAR